MSLEFWGIIHKSARHAYQYAKAQQAGKNKIAEFYKQTPLQADRSQIPAIQPKLDKQERECDVRNSVRKDEELMNVDKVLAEGVPGDMYWSTGLTKEQSLLVKKSSWPGKLLTEIRESHKKNRINIQT